MLGLRMEAENNPEEREWLAVCPATKMLLSASH